MVCQFINLYVCHPIELANANIQATQFGLFTNEITTSKTDPFIIKKFILFRNILKLLKNIPNFIQLKEEFKFLI